MNGIVKIMRGLPGSGKSHYVQNKLHGGSVTPHVCSADFYHMEEGKYNFRPERAGDAHRRCFTDFYNGLEVGKPLVVVDNTNTDPVEIAPYYKLAEHFYYDVEIIWLNTRVETCIQRQTHGVPLGTMIAMAMNIRRPMPRYWKWVEIVG